jgi:hypothetical protein
MSTQIRGAQIRTLFAGDALDWVSVSGTDRNYLAVQVDDSSIEVSGDALQVKALGISNAMLAGSIADDKLVEDYIKTSEVDGSTIEFAGNSLNIVASGVTEIELNPSVAGDGLAGGGGTALSVNVDGTSIAITTDTLGVIDSGIDHGSISGLADDDHTQYSLADGTRAFTGTVSGVTPTEDAHLTTKQYVDSNISTTSGNILSYVSDNYVDNSEMTTISGDILTYVSTNYIDNSEMATISGDIMQGVSDGYIDNSEMTTISGDIISYVSDNYVDNSEMTTISGDIISYVSTNYVDNSEMTTISGDIISYVDSQDSAISGSLQSDIVWEVVDTPTNRIQPKLTHMGLPLYTSGDVTIGGDLTVTGTMFYTDTETVQLSDNVIVVNYGEVGAGVTNGSAGIEVDRGSMTDYYFVFDETQDNFRIGISGALQAVATREDTPNDTSVPFWNASAVRFDTSANLTFDATNGLKLGSGADVNEIVDSTGAIDASSTDDQLATTKLIYSYIEAVSGSLTLAHNELDGLQGGNGSDEYYHLNSTAYTALSGVDSTEVSHWDTAYGWGDHSTFGYLTTETDPVFGASPAAGISSGDISNWDSAYTHSTTTTGNPHSLDLDDVPDGTTYGRVLNTQLSSNVYIDATTSTKGIASFSSDNFDVTAGAVTIKDGGVAEAELDIANAPADGLYLQYTTASGMQWTDLEVTNAVTESDIMLQNETSNCNGSTTGFTLDNTPVDSSVQVFLNGLLQEKGSGKDYTQTGTTVTFSVAPLAGDILLIHYVAKD